MGAKFGSVQEFQVSTDLEIVDVGNISTHRNTSRAEVTDITYALENGRTERIVGGHQPSPLYSVEFKIAALIRKAGSYFRNLR